AAHAGVSLAFRQRLLVKAASGRVAIEAEVRDRAKVVATKRSFLDVYSPSAFRWPARGFALFDPQGQGKYQRSGLTMRSFAGQQSQPRIVVIPKFTALWKQQAEFEQFLRAVAEARRGSTLLFLGIPGDGGVPEEFRQIHFHLQFSPLTVASILGFRLDLA